MNEFQYNGITIGTDPEFFIQNQDGKLISSIGIIHGTKDMPNRLPLLGSGFAIQCDNVLGEFNVPFGYTPKEVANNVAMMKSYITGYLAGYGLAPLYIASGVFEEDQLQSLEAKEFGCSPDFNAWLNCTNFKPDGESTNLRSAGMHFHVGYQGKNAKRSRDIIKAMDVFLGVPSVIIDTDTKRRSLYGKAGCFRHTDFGVEYRTPSGFILSDHKLIEWAFGQVFQAIDYLNANGINQIMEDADLIIDTINSGNIGQAELLVLKYNINLNY